MDLHYAVPDTIIGIGSILLLFAPRSPQYRGGPRWIRVGFLLAGVCGIGCSALGFYLHLVALHWARYWLLHYIHVTLGGMALGILILMILSPDFYRSRKDQATPNV